MPAIADVPKPDPLQEALRILTSAFPPTKFKIENGQITGGGITVAPGLIKGSPLAMVRIEPARGATYYLVDSDGDGRIDRQPHGSRDVPVYFKLYEW